MSSRRARYIRQADLIKCDLSTPILIIGAGAIGSFTALSLAKMGFESLTVFDMDTVEDHNLPNQFFRQEDVGKPKVLALREIVRDFTGTELITYQEAYDRSHQIRTRVVISAVDNMATRNELYKEFQESDAQYFIDGRMGADQIEVYAVPKGNSVAERMYESRLWKDDETSPVRCTSRATMYNVLMIAGLIANYTRQMLQRDEVPPALIFDNKNIGLYLLKR